MATVWLLIIVAMGGISFLSFSRLPVDLQGMLPISTTSLWAPRYPSDPNLPTIAINRFQRAGQGFFNQQMAFAAVMMRITNLSRRSSSGETNYQVLLPSLAFRDYLGTNQWIPLDQLFDVDYWNTYFPQLPRFVSWHPSQHYQFDSKRLRMVVQNQNAATNYTHPQYLSDTKQSFQDYVRYYQSLPPIPVTNNDNRTDKGEDEEALSRLHPTDRLLLQGALRPAPAMRAALQQFWNNNNAKNYLAIHLRMEPDYLCHHWGGQGLQHGRNLTEIIDRIQVQLSQRPMDRCFVAVNRRVLEDPTKIPAKAFPSVQACERERQANLEALNRLIQNGLWDGRVPVVERPPALAKGKQSVVSTSSLWGALMDAEICRHATIFVGRLGSTFALNIIRRRSAMGNHENYNYEHGWDKVGGVGQPYQL